MPPPKSSSVPPPAEVDCLVLDVYLGGMNGYDLHSLLTAEGQAPPTVFVTAHDDVKVAMRPAGRRRVPPQAVR